MSANTNLDLSYLHRLIEDQTEESVSLEFKEDLPLAEGARGWRHSTRLHRSEVAGLAKEIVSFANTYGGRVLVGIEEASDPLGADVSPDFGPPGWRIFRAEAHDGWDAPEPFMSDIGGLLPMAL